MVEEYDPGLRLEIKTKVIANRNMWFNYNKVKNAKPPTIHEFVNQLINVCKINAKMGLFLSILYLSGSRIHEILHYTYRGNYSKSNKQRAGLPTIAVEKPGLTLRNIWWEEDYEGNKWLVMVIRNEKQNSKRGEDKIEFEKREEILRKTEVKTIRLPYSEDFPDFPLIKFLDDEFQDCGYYNTDDEEGTGLQFKAAEIDKEMFDYTYRTAYRNTLYHLGVSPHNLREIRMRHFREFYHMDVSELQALGGWKSAAMPLRYAKASEEALKNKFLQWRNTSETKQ